MMSAFATLPLPNFHGQMDLLNFMIRLVSPLQFNISSPFHQLIMKDSEKRVLTVMVNNSTNISKTNNHFTP